MLAERSLPEGGQSLTSCIDLKMVLVSVFMHVPVSTVSFLMTTTVIKDYIPRPQPFLSILS